jgi:RpiB/LacA/LacB family sugar-phosphate isomerase
MKYNLLLPIAGKAQRFVDEGYAMPKPLIMAKTKQVIDWAMESINTKDCNLIFAVRLEHINNFSIDEILRQKFGENTKIVVVDHDTDGSVSTCLLARDHINNNDPLIIYTPDVYFQNTFDPSSINEDLDGLLLTFKANSPAHSYVSTNKDGFAIKTAEKQVISSDAAVGVYYFKKGRYFVDYAEELVKKDIRTKDEFYICPMYNLLIRDGLSVSIKQVEKMHVLGTPEELEFFVDKVAHKFGEKPVGLCSDHSGYERKEDAKKVLKSLGIEYVDFGCHVEKDVDYNAYVNQSVESLNNKVCDFILGFCRTGQGINILANHQNGVRAALIFDEYTAEMSRRHNCANFFSIPSKYTSLDSLKSIVDTLLKSSFDGGRHMTRINSNKK